MKRYDVPEPGETTKVILGPREELVAVRVLGAVKRRAIEYRAFNGNGQRATTELRTVECVVLSTGQTQAIAVERFPRIPC